MCPIEMETSAFTQKVSTDENHKVSATSNIACLKIFSLSAFGLKFLPPVNMNTI
jgi:hypothetical protein